MSSGFILLFVIALVLWLWYAGLRAREIAVRAARETCQRQGLQMLDGSVVLKRMRPQRNRRGHMALLRGYQFEYSEDGMNRQQGFVIVLGFDLQQVGLARPQAVEDHGRVDQ